MSFMPRMPNNRQSAAHSAEKSREDVIAIKGRKLSHGGSRRNRLAMAIIFFLAAYSVIGGRLIFLGTEDDGANRTTFSTRHLASRPDIVDRNGEVLATDIKTASLYAEPRRIVDADEATESLTSVLPGLDFQATIRKLKSGAGFVWIKRELTPRQEAEIHALGIPGLGFRTEKKRFYPGGPTASHILGLVNVDNQGIAGMEKYIDDHGLSVLRETGLADEAALEPVRLSIDLRVQHIVRDELVQAMDKFKAIGAGAVVLNAKTGEVIAMSSQPDYDPNNPVNALDKDRLNRMSAGIYEMGSTIKAFTTAMALDSGEVHLGDKFDASHPLKIAGFTIHDFHSMGRALTVPEIFTHSSNIGTARMAEKIGIEEHQAFLTRIGLLTRLNTELPEVATPSQPTVWKKINSVTIAFGHGMATTPLQTAVSAAALLNGGLLFNPTFLPRSQTDADGQARQVLNPRTSIAMRYLFRLNVEKGSGRRADVPGYFVGGKTGTAEKVVNGRYSSDKRFNAFLAGFPADNPQYVVLVILDEPKPEEPGMYATAGMNAAPTVANIIRRSAALLGVKPEFGHESDALLVAYQ
jgi:cell division protein FtsI (penicillin-binding protein 3)